MIHRRDLYRYGTHILGGLMGLALAVPGVAYLLDPLGKKSQAAEFHTLARLGELKVGEPRAYRIIDDRVDAWVRYPREPVGSVWLIRQPPGSDEVVVALSAECPHLGCAVNLAADGKKFQCPCHTSAFDFRGQRLNQIPPRGMDRLEVEGAEAIDPQDPDAEIRVRFQRFRTMSEEKIPLG
jgi:menaquinol-cytochrome c reductase iron-sulfur subunit